MDASSMKRLKELEEKNVRLKKMYAEEKLKVGGLRLYCAVTKLDLRSKKITGGTTL